MTELHSPISVQIHGLHKSFGANTVLAGIDLQIRKGEVVVIMGPSGSGKTTLIRSLNFLEVADQGVLQVCGITVDAGEFKLKPTRDMHMRIRDIRRRTAMVFQSFNLFGHMTAVKNVMEGLISVKGQTRGAARVHAMELLGKVGLADKADAYPQHLSGGQKQRVAIARALAMDPEVILFDEPTSALDPELREEVLKVMRELADDGITMIVVTHEVRFARDVADRVVFMEGGHILQDCPPSAFFRGNGNERIRRFLGLIEA